MGERYSDDRSQGGGGHGGSSGRWLVSYADFVTLMFVVFVVLFSMARVDSAKFGKLKASLSNSIGIQPLPTGGNPVNTAPIQPGTDQESAPGAPAPKTLEPITPAPPVPSAIVPEEKAPAPEQPKPAPVQTTTPKPATTTPKPATTTAPKPAPVDPLAKVSEGLKDTVAGRAGQIDVEIKDRGVVVSILTSVLFQEGKAELRPEAPKLLDQISIQLKASTESVLVEGAPDAAASDAPWDLSSKRASAVVSYLVSTHGLAPDRFSVIGYGKGAGVDGIVNVVVLRRQ